MSIVRKILGAHLVKGELVEGTEIAIKIDQTLTQDATGTMAYLQFEALNLPKVKTELSVSYVDHNVSSTGSQNVEFLRSFADKYGIIFSEPGNGICHQVHLERFSKPGATLLGSDSHTPTCGGIGQIAIGVGGLDIAMAMAGKEFYLTMPTVVGVKLTGKLNPWVSAKDVILEMLRRLTVKGGVGKIFEYFGDGVKTLSVPERSTITNMGAELGATTSIFPSDEQTKIYLEAQVRADLYQPLEGDGNYDEIIEINLSELEPLIACPSSPDNVKKVTEVQGTKIHQLIIGSCTNSSYKDLALLAQTLRDHKIADLDFFINPGSMQVVKTLKDHDLYQYLEKSGARIYDPACLGCIGMDQEPKAGTNTLRTFNRNFKGRSGTKDDFNYLCSPEVAVASLIKGEITDPRSLGDYPTIELPAKFSFDDRIKKPTQSQDIIRGEIIAPLPLREALTDDLSGSILIKTGDNITTDDIMPAGSKIIPLRGHIPRISEFVFHHLDPDFAKNAKEKKGGFILGGENYGQGSSREHAALAPMYLGIKAVIAKSFARIHKANLVNFGIIPLEFKNKDDYDKLSKDDVLELNDVIGCLKNNQDLVLKGKDITVTYNLSDLERDIIIAGGKLNHVKNDS